jgi:flagellar export protein FliJ
MKKFSFSLETARKWRERQAEIEEVRLQALFAEKRAMEDRAVSLQTELDAGELARLDDFQVWVTREKRRLGTSLSECEQRIEARRAALVEARRRFQLVDRLKEKALLEWRKTSEKEQEDLAAELYLARRTRHDG